MGLAPPVRVRAATVVGDDPVEMLGAPAPAPAPAPAKALKPAGCQLADIGAFGMNDAVDSAVGVWLKETGADPSLVDPDGAMALGHPLGGSGARLATTLDPPHGRSGHPIIRAGSLWGFYRA